MTADHKTVQINRGEHSLNLSSLTGLLRKLNELADNSRDEDTANHTNRTNRAEEGTTAGRKESTAYRQRTLFAAWLPSARLLPPASLMLRFLRHLVFKKIRVPVRFFMPAFSRQAQLPRRGPATCTSGLARRPSSLELGAQLERGPNVKGVGAQRLPP